MKFDRLKDQNNLFDNDELLVTFARRTDQEARDSWDDLKSIASSKDKEFHEKMTKAQAMALKKGSLSTDYKKSPVKAYVILIGGFFGYQYLNLSFTVEEDGVEEITGDVISESELSELIEIQPNKENPKIGDVKINDQGAFDWLVDQSNLMMEAILD